MKAAVVRSFDRPLEIEELPIPVPGPDQVLVRIEACGLCHTDIHAARGEWPVKPSPPFIPGHEGVGIIERVGAGNTHGLEPGMRVALPWLGYACGACQYCNSGRETLCLSQLNMGYAINGGFAEYAVGYARHVVRVPDGVDPADAAPLTCAGVTTYKAVKVSGARSSDLVAVFGVGGLGHLAVQYARITGAVRRRRRRQRGAPADRARARRRAHRQRRRRGPGRGDPAARRRRRRDRHRRHAEAVRAGLPLARARRPARLRRPARRQPPGDPDLRDRPRRTRPARLDRRHPPRPRGGLRAAPPRPHARRIRRAPPGRRQRGDRAGPRRQRPDPPARLPHGPELSRTPGARPAQRRHRPSQRSIHP